MAKHTIIIDGPIAQYGYSKQFIRNQLQGHDKDEIILIVSSLGGNIDDALSIHDQLVNHGNVTIQLSAFVASAATLLTLGAKKISMNENSFYLIHKAMNWIDEWNLMNEDEIEALIEKLEKQKQELSKVTLQLAKMYVKRTGKSLDEIITLMKKNTWLTAQEALEWGFIDEINSVENYENYLDNPKMVALITASGMPVPPRVVNTQDSLDNSIDEESLFERLWNKIKRKQSENSYQSKQKQMKQSFLNVCKVLKVDSFESSDEGIYLDQDQLRLIEDQLGREQTILDERDTAISERDSARQEFSTSLSLLDAIDRSVADAGTVQEKADAIRALLSVRPGTSPEGNKDGQDPVVKKKEADWETINKLPHNLEVDNNL